MSPSSLRIAALCCALVPWVVGCARKEAPPPPLRPVLTQVVGVQPGGEANVYSGEVRSRYETPLGFRVGGKIVARLVNVGATVKTGDLLARLDPTDLTLSLSAADAQLALAEAEFKRYRELREKNFISASGLDAKETAYKAAKAQADLARNQAAYTELRSDRDGVVQSVAAELGQVVAAGQPVMSVARSDTLEVAVALPEKRVPHMRVNDRAEIGLWSDESAKYAGVVREISRTADPATRTYAARITILNPDARVLLGMTANVRLLVADSSAGGGTRFSVPLAAVFQQDGKPALWVVGKDETLALRRVDVLAYGELNAVVGGGIASGERIVVAGVHKLTAGEKIRSVDSSTAAAR